ncbi:MAG: hypothetical protein JST54_04045 [Deltaproteobacteria bacterium]|nr:hypothetical protein [Deltaproteobacteria bacterium]
MRVTLVLLCASVLAACSGSSGSSGSTSGTSGAGTTSSGSTSGSGTTTGTSGTTGELFSGPLGFNANHQLFAPTGEFHYPDAGPILQGFDLQLSNQNNDPATGADCTPRTVETLTLDMNADDGGSVVGQSYPIAQVASVGQAAARLAVQDTVTGQVQQFNASSGTLSISEFNEDLAGSVVTFEMLGQADLTFPLTDGGSFAMSGTIDLAQIVATCH